MGFWLRKSIFGAILVILAIILLSNLEFFFSLDIFGSDKATVPQEQTPTASEEPAAAPKKKQPEKYSATIEESKNAAAEGLSKFYASINPDLVDGSKPRIRQGVVYLPKPTGDLEKILEARRMVIRPFPPSWRGSKVNRPFRKDHTLYQKLDEYAREDGLELIWWLDKDLVIKDPFRINKGILQTAYQIGQALNGHFQDGVSTYFCYKQRNIVLVEGKVPYLDDECRLLDFNKY